MSIQSKESIEEWYSKPDPWGYKNNPDDKKRKKIILSYLDKPYNRALDIGCGEGWISKDLPAETVEGYEISVNARKRLPGTVLSVSEPSGKYDLIVGTGIMYQQYDWQHFLDLILRYGNGTVLLCNIAEWEQDLSRLGDPIEVYEFPYKGFTERLRIYELS